MKLLLRNARIVSPGDGYSLSADIYIKDGIISAIKNSIAEMKNAQEIDLKGKTVVPGLFDMHVHFREPGQTHKETVLTGALAAANGGFTGVLCMPNTSPPIDNPVLLSQLKSAYSNNVVDIEFAACATKGRRGEELSPLLSLAKAGAIAFTDDGSPVSDPELLRRIFEYAAQTSTPFIQHCEDMKLSNSGVINEGLISTVTGLKGIPSVSETSVIARDIEICSYIGGAHYHIQHMSCGGSVRLLREAKSHGLNVTGEVCPHHFILTDKSCLVYDTNFKMNPPLRSREDIDMIVEGLADDTIDVICTDHAPHTEYEKLQGFNDAPFGIIGLETAFGLAYTYLVKTGVLNFEQLITKMSVNPRKILGLEPVSIQPGKPANLSVLDLSAKWTVKKNKFMTNGRNTPFEGYRLSGKPFMIVNKDQTFFSKL